MYVVGDNQRVLKEGFQHAEGAWPDVLMRPFEGDG